MVEFRQQRSGIANVVARWVSIDAFLLREDRLVSAQGIGARIALCFRRQAAVNEKILSDNWMYASRDLPSSVCVPALCSRWSSGRSLPCAARKHLVERSMKQVVRVVAERFHRNGKNDLQHMPLLIACG